MMSIMVMILINTIVTVLRRFKLDEFQNSGRGSISATLDLVDLTPGSCGGPDRPGGPLKYKQPGKL